MSSQEQIALGAFFLFCALAFFLGKRFLKFFLFFLCLFLVNWIAHRWPVWKDFSYAQLSSFSPEGEKFLKKIKGPLKFYCVGHLEQRKECVGFVEMMTRSRPDWAIEEIDPDLRPDFILSWGKQNTQGLQIEVLGASHQKNRANVFHLTEKNVLRAIARAVEGKEYRVWYLTGDNTPSFETFSYALQSLEAAGISLQELSADKLSLLGEKDPVILLYQEEGETFLKAVRDLLLGIESANLWKGNLVLLLSGHKPLKGDFLFLLKQFLDSQGIDYLPYFVAEESWHLKGSKGTVPLASLEWEGQKITWAIPLPASLMIKKGKEKLVEVLSWSSEKSWAETTPNELKEGILKYQHLQDIPGPFPLLLKTQMNIERNTNQDSQNILKRSLFIMTSSQFFLDQYQHIKGNFDLFSRVILEAVSQEDSLDYAVASLESTDLTLEQHHYKIPFHLSVWLLPSLLIAISFWIYKRYRFIL